MALSAPDHLVDVSSDRDVNANVTEKKSPEAKAVPTVGQDGSAAAASEGAARAKEASGATEDHVKHCHVMRLKKRKRKGHPNGCRVRTEEKASSEAVGECDDLLFFKSLIPYMKTISPMLKLRLRTEMQGLIVKYIDIGGKRMGSRPNSPLLNNIDGTRW